MLNQKTIQRIVNTIIRAQPTLTRDGRVVLKIYQARTIWHKILEQKEKHTHQLKISERQEEERKALQKTIERQQTILNLFSTALPQAQQVLLTQKVPKNTPEIITDTILAAQILLIEFSKKEQLLKNTIQEQINAITRKDLSLYDQLYNQETQLVQQIADKSDALLEEAKEEQEERWQSVIQIILAGGGATRYLLTGQTAFGIVLALMTMLILLGLLRERLHRR